MISDHCATLPEQFVVNRFGDHYLYEVNHTTLNDNGAEAIHQQRFGKLITKENHLFLITGTDSGTLLSYLQKAAIGSGTRIILVELPEVLEKIAGLLDLQTLDAHVRCVVYDELPTALEQYNLKNYIYIDSVQILQSLASEYSFLPQYQELLWNLQTSLTKTAWQINASLGSETFLIKQLENIGENQVPSTCLRGIFQEGTAVVLAGGPSLDSMIPWIKEHRESLFLLAVSRISRRLREADIIPDMVFSIDPHGISFDISKEMLLSWEQTLFVHVYHVAPQLLGQWRGRSVYLGPLFPWETGLNVESLAHPGPTVSNVALSVAMDMGFSRIILAGLDLCHSKTGQTHALGSNEAEAGPQLGKTCILVETNEGGLAETTSDFAAAIEMLALQARDLQEKGIDLINPAPGAARIAGITHQPLDTIVVQPFTENPAKILDKALPAISREYKKSHYNKILKELIHANGQLLQIKKLVDEALHCNDGLFGRKGIRQDFKYKKRMDKIENKLNKQFRAFSRLVKSMGIRDFLKLTRIDFKEDWLDSELEEKTASYYKAYAKSTRRLLELVKTSKKRIESRLQEIAEHPKLDVLIAQWQADKQPGRAQVWLAANGLTLAELPAQDRERFAALADEFEQIIATRDTVHMQRSKQFAALSGVRGKALAFFRQENTDGLQRLVESLRHHPDPEAEKYLHLTTGYLLELQGDSSQALEEYQALFSDLAEPLVEDGLRRVASLSLDGNDITNALLALQLLSNMSPVYLNQYGDLLRLTGSSQEALHAYLSYLECAPADIAHMLKLGKYYRTLNIEEGAKAIFEHVLLLDAENRAAKELLQAPGRTL